MANGMGSVFTDPHFQDELLRFLVHDREFLRSATSILTPEDFSKRTQKEGIERRTVAEIALNFFNRYREPVGKLLTVELLDYCRRQKWNGDKEDAVQKRVLAYGEQILLPKKRVAPDAILSKVKQYKVETRVANAMESMQDLVESGELTTDAFMDLARTAVDIGKEAGRPIDIFDKKELEKRIHRRDLQQRRQRFPALLIEPIDRQIRIIARRHLGLILAPYKRGKSMLFIWLALAYTLQGLNVLYFTLEDPMEDVEDRFDAAITALPMSRLVELPNRVRERFSKYTRMAQMARARLKVVDGTDGAITIPTVENIFEQERNRGFNADVVIIDYDDEIKPARKQLERRMEFADIYRDFRAFLSRHECIGWTASQTSRKSDDLKIIGGKHIAEDISKIRKCSFAIALGQGDWGEKSIFLWVAAHRYDTMNIGANIMTDKERSLFYDRDATIKKEKEELEKKEAVTP